MTRLQRGDAVPFFDVGVVGGGRQRYADLWQRDPLLLIRVAGTAGDWAPYVSELQRRAAELRQHGTALVITAGEIGGMPQPGALVADRWGEIQEAHWADDPADMPGVDALLDTLWHLHQRCPECEGETK